MAEEYRKTEQFKGASFELADFSGARFHDCDLRNVKITDSWLTDINISGLIGNVVVNDVDVTAYVEGELDRQHPERAQVRSLETPADYRAMWDTIERLWEATLARYDKLPEQARFEGVDGEWSLAETFRHLVFATDAWVYRTVLDQDRPYHRLGLPQSGYPRDGAAELGVDLDATPSWAEVLAARADRAATMRRVVDGLTEDELARTTQRNPAPEYPEREYVFGRCIGVVLREEVEHHRYIVRDLAVLEAR